MSILLLSCDVSTDNDQHIVVQGVVVPFSDNQIIVFDDNNSNSNLNYGEAFTTTNDTGAYQLTTTTSPRLTACIYSDGIDKDSKSARICLRSNSDIHDVSTANIDITPFTTIVHAYALTNNLSYSQARVDLIDMFSDYAEASVFQRVWLRMIYLVNQYYDADVNEYVWLDDVLEIASIMIEYSNKLDIQLLSDAEIDAMIADVVYSPLRTYSSGGNNPFGFSVSGNLLIRNLTSNKDAAEFRVYAGVLYAQVKSLLV